MIIVGIGIKKSIFFFFLNEEEELVSCLKKKIYTKWKREGRLELVTKLSNFCLFSEYL